MGSGLWARNHVPGPAMPRTSASCRKPPPTLQYGLSPHPLVSITLPQLHTELSGMGGHCPALPPSPQPVIWPRIRVLLRPPQEPIPEPRGRREGRVVGLARSPAPEAPPSPGGEADLRPLPSITEEAAVGATATSSPLPAASSAEPAGCLGNGRRRGDAPRDGGVCHRGSCRAPAPRPRPVKVPRTLPTPCCPSPRPPHPIQRACFSEENAPFLPARRPLPVPHEPPLSRPLSTAVLSDSSSFQPHLWGPWHRKAHLLGWGLARGERESGRTRGSGTIGCPPKG